MEKQTHIHLNGLKVSKFKFLVELFIYWFINFFYWVQMTNLVIPLNYAHHRGSHLDHQHHVTLQEGTTTPTLSPPAEKSKSPTTHPPHILQATFYRGTIECADQLHHCLVRELQCCWPQDPPADSEHSCKDHRCPSPIHPGHFPCTMLRVRTTGELGGARLPLIRHGLPWKSDLWNFGGSQKILTMCYFDVQFQFCVMWSSWIIMCKIAKISFNAWRRFKPNSLQ